MQSFMNACSNCCFAIKKLLNIEYLLTEINKIDEYFCVFVIPKCKPYISPQEMRRKTGIFTAYFAEKNLYICRKNCGD